MITAALGGPFARVAIAIPVRELFDYRIPEALGERLQPGMRVRVPFGRRHCIGYCIERAAASRHPTPKDVAEVLDEVPTLTPDVLRLVQWTADYYLASVGEAIESAVPKRVREGKKRRTKKGAAPASAEAPRATPPHPSSLPLSPAQSAAIEAIRAAAAAPRFEAFLLYGVTGSGKTEVYLRAIESVVARGRGALVLLPEIALTPQTVARFRARFADVAVLHSLLPAEDRSAAFRRLQSGATRVAIGARSAVFAPIRDLGIIIVDECHESSYKQESAPRYHATDVATMRASQLGIPCVLGSATPSLEQLGNVERGRFTMLRLPERVTGQALAHIELVDRRPEMDSGRALPLLSPRLLLFLRDTLSSGGQAILLLNRRGFARYLHCPACGFALRCDACAISLTYHKRSGLSLCHYCGAARPLPQACPACEFAGLLQKVPGTERVEETLNDLLPGVALARLDRDTATSGGRMEAILERFRSGAARILIGTQMVAKGHDIPAVTLVGVLDADIALGLPDFRSAERTFQLLCQVAGRAGRGTTPGRVLVQTRQPDHYAIEAARRQDPDYLFERERPARKLLGYPPFGHLARVLFADPDETRALQEANALRDHLDELQSPPGLAILGPAPAPLARLRNRFRYHLLIKARNRADLRAAAERAAAWAPAGSAASARMTIDIDPQNLL